MNDDLKTSDALAAALSRELRAYVEATERVARLAADGAPGQMEAIRAAQRFLAVVEQQQDARGMRTPATVNRTMLDAVLAFQESWSNAQCVKKE